MHDQLSRMCRRRGYVALQITAHKNAADRQGGCHQCWIVNFKPTVGDIARDPDTADAAVEQTETVGNSIGEVVRRRRAVAGDLQVAYGVCPVATIEPLDARLRRDEAMDRHG